MITASILAKAATTARIGVAGPPVVPGFVPARNLLQLPRMDRVDPWKEKARYRSL